MEKKVLAVRRGNLFGEHGRAYFQGFQREDSKKAGEIKKNIQLHGEYIPKKDLENNPTYKQIATYCVLFNRESNMFKDDSGVIFSYKRAGAEARLKDEWSLGVSGHIYTSAKNVIRSGMLENLSRETNVVMYTEALSLMGYINCDDSPINRDHLGVLYFAEVFNVEDIRTRSKDLLRGKFRSQQAIEEMLNRHKFEEWSEIAYEVLLRERLKDSD
jgi:predicted NUDIX family phosphoesterase